MEDMIDKTNRDLTMLNESVELLTDENERLREEIHKQAEKMDKQDEKLDYMENQSRRQNLMFHNLPQKENETWEDCESSVLQVIRDLLGITTNVLIDRAHRVGRAVVVRFQNFKDKELVLKTAHKLKGQNTKIGISEDFSRTVREKRRGLRGVMKQYHARRERANLVFDKLYTPDGVFTFDTDTKQINKVDGPRPGYTRVNNTTNNRDNETRRSHTQAANSSGQSEPTNHNRSPPHSPHTRPQDSHAHYNTEHYDSDDSQRNTARTHSDKHEQPQYSRNLRPRTRLFTATHLQQQQRQQHHEQQQFEDREREDGNAALRGFGRGKTPPEAAHRFEAREADFTPTNGSDNPTGQTLRNEGSSSGRRGGRGRGYTPRGRGQANNSNL